MPDKILLISCLNKLQKLTQLTGGKERTISCHSVTKKIYVPKEKIMKVVFNLFAHLMNP